MIDATVYFLHCCIDDNILYLTIGVQCITRVTGIFVLSLNTLIMYYAIIIKLADNEYSRNIIWLKSL